MNSKISADPAGRGSGTGLLLTANPGADLKLGDVYVGDGQNENAAAPTATDSTVYLCAVSVRGTKTYCGKGDAGKVSFAHAKDASNSDQTGVLIAPGPGP